ncbi:hypothetical protein SAMN04489860_2306 [Paraoerskovia marina]|uniref:UPF0182 protein SAMN04489860_2306 n=1 Tax=Paraoerskovia marina TaxID=545619 RepID=A0A1H1UUS8_9CELL|nr:UPF0182 family protein [Paraoerskovia marina]SDS76328.1 hypothetical protein SAMN04489860_2306 [Paraoerskovia marina]
MTFAAGPRRAPEGPPAQRRRSPLVITLIVLAAIVVALFLLAEFWTEVLWFTQLGYQEVLWTEWGVRAGLFVAGFLIMGAAIFASLSIAYRSRPIYAPSTPEQATLDQYREAVEPLRKVVTWGAPVVIGFFAGTAASGQWQNVLLAVNQVSFDQNDPIFGMDLSFFVFTLPILRFSVGFFMAIVIVAGIGALATHYLYGGLRIGGSNDAGPRTTKAARVQLAVLGALLLVGIALNYWLDRYSLLTAQGTKFDGASYTDVNAVMPAKAILAVVALVVAVLFVVAAVRGTWRLPAIGVGLMVVSAIVIGGIYPAIVQRFQVDPNAQELESEYIQRNIDSTTAAFGLDKVETQQYDAATEAEAGALREDAETTAQIRLLDPQIVSPTFRQLQQNKQYYNFDETLAVDRYEIDGEKQDSVVAVRELNLAGLGDDQRNWVNDHTVFTHGFGMVAAYGNQTGPDGRPAFFEGDIPAEGALTDMGEGYEPRVYFSPQAPEYSIVGAPDESNPWELDFPDDEAGGQVNSTFGAEDGAVAGPDIGSFGSKLLYALKFGSGDILFSDRVTEESQIIYDRDPRSRVQKIAPYLTLDQRVYPAVVDGRIKYVVEGYTTTDQYPYSAQRALDEAVADSLTSSGSASIQAIAPEEINYIRNSVKATVDAYDGSVDLYAWEPEDPMLQAWQGVFPEAVKPMSEISGDLMDHLRYPEDLFKVQRSLLTAYHVTDASDFFSGQDFWQNPEDPTDTSGSGALQPPYYLTLQMPDQTEPTFSLTSSFIPGGNTDREILTGFLAVDAEAGSEDGKRSEDYGKLRLLELPRNATVPGPGQVQNNFDSNSTIASELNILSRGNSEVIHGNLLTLPVGGGLLYVQPVYVQSSQGTQYPLLRKVLVSFGDEVGFADTLDEALNQVFGGDSGADAGDAGGETESEVDDAPLDGTDTDTGTDTGTETEEPTAEPTETSTATEEPSPEPSTPGTFDDPQAALDQALTEAAQAMQDADEALSSGDWASYGDAQDALDEALQTAIDAESQLSGS